MFFLKISNIGVSFAKNRLTRKFYTTNKALSIIKQVSIVNLKEFVIVALDVNSKIFILHVAIQKWEKIRIYFKKQAYIRVLLFDKTFTKVLAEYSDYSNVFLIENAVDLSENTKINEHAIKLEKGK